MKRGEDVWSEITWLRGCEGELARGPVKAFVDKELKDVQAVRRSRLKNLTLASLRFGSRTIWRIAASDRSDETSMERRVAVVLNTELEIASWTAWSPERSGNRSSSSVSAGREVRMGITLGMSGVTRTLSEVRRGDRKRLVNTKVSVAEY